MDIQDAMAIQMAATERLERARTEAMVARPRRPESELAEARAAYDAAQDLPCPEA